MDNKLLPQEIGKRILLVRGQRIMLDSALAAIYGVSTKQLNQQVRRNSHRFPSDFMFQLTPQEAKGMRSQIVTARKRNVRHSPYAFTEHGAIMLASVLNSPTAIKASVQVVRVFVQMRAVVAESKELSRRLDLLEMKYDIRFKIVFDAVRRLMEPKKKPRPRIGFRP